ncbi:MAG: 23S rRNA (uracil(1939)-C(5))-methyltransferase RlmD [Clostridiales bacterium]|nr:23S rRNA (uracil(1939)-C(5))-methyltransferase RlmD [Clostridiales bacterium]
MSKNSGRKYTERSRLTSKRSRQTPEGNRRMPEGSRRISIERKQTSDKQRKPADESRRSPDRRKRPVVSSAQENGLKKSDRQPICPVMKKCGGCQYRNVTYERQLAMKQEKVSKLLQPFCRVYPIAGMEDPYHYRNKVHAVFDHLKDGTIISGVYEEKTHRVVPVDDCLIEDEKADAIIRDIRGMLRSFKIKTYDEDTGYGLLRHVLVRRGFATGQIMVVLVLGSPILPSKNNFVQALRKLHPEISTIIINVNNKKTSMVLGEKETVVYGKGYIEDVLCGQTFRISSKSFYQVNPVQTEKLYAKAIELAGLSGKERVIDAYCGIGTIGICAAARAREVIGVELNRDAVRDAVRNAKRNEKKNILFYNADAGEFMTQMVAQGEQADVVFVDPPRSGCSEAFLRAVVRVRPARIVYISCYPETQARDLKYLTANGFRAQGAYPYDCFPFTGHVETIVQLNKPKQLQTANI